MNSNVYISTFGDFREQLYTSLLSGNYCDAKMMLYISLHAIILALPAQPPTIAGGLDLVYYSSGGLTREANRKRLQSPDVIS